jgi:predicted transposase/invertase (TIGR01784 family)
MRWRLLLMTKEKMRFTEDDDPVDIRYDNVFKAVFTRGTPESQCALSRLVSALVSRKLSIVAIGANEPAVEDLRHRQIRFDIRCEAEDGEPVNVEMSLNPEPYEPVRLEFHAGRLFAGQEIRGEDKTYDDLKQAYQVTILAKKRFFGDEIPLHTFEYYDPEHGVSLNGRTRIITLELSKLGKVVEKPVKDMSAPELWGVFFGYLQDKAKRGIINEILEMEEGIAMASEVLMTISRDKVERARLESELKYELDTQSRLVHAERKGLAKGLAKGKAENTLEIARNLKKMGLSVSQIADGTGLSPEAVEKL